MGLLSLRSRIQTLWRDRSGLLEISVCNSKSLSLVGVHGPHLDDKTDFLSDISLLLGSRSKPGPTSVLGDWNVDVLPLHPHDPFAPRPVDASQRERKLLNSWARSSKLQIHLPEFYNDVPGSPWDLECLLCPITRLPDPGDAHSKPTCLDFSANTPNILSTSACFWYPRVSDHAMTMWKLDLGTHVRFFPKSKWKCTDEQGFLQSAKQCMDTAPESVVGFLPFVDIVKSCSNVYAERSCNKMRRFVRVPLQIRSAYRRAHFCSDQSQRPALLKRAWELRKLWSREGIAGRARDRVDEGKVFVRSKKLFPLHNILTSHDSTAQASLRLCDRAQMCSHCAQLLLKKWGGSDFSALSSCDY